MDRLYTNTNEFSSAVSKNLETYPFLMPYAKQVQVSSKSLNVYCNRFVQFIQYLQNQYAIQIEALDHFKNVTTSQIASFINNRKDSDTTKKSKYYALNSLFNFLQTNKMIISNPMKEIAIPKVKVDNSVQYLSNKEVQKIYRYLEREVRTSTSNMKEAQARRDLALFSLAITTGLKPSILLDINIENIKDNKLWIQERVIRLDKTTCIHIQDYLQVKQVSKGPLFMGRNKQRLTVRAYEKILDSLSGVVQRKVNPQLIRSTYAHKALLSNKSSVEVAKQMGISPVTLVSRYLKEEECV